MCVGHPTVRIRLNLLKLALSGMPVFNHFIITSMLVLLLSCTVIVAVVCILAVVTIMAVAVSTVCLILLRVIL